MCAINVSHQVINTSMYTRPWLLAPALSAAAVLNQPDRPAPTQPQLLHLRTEYRHVHVATMRRAESAREQMVRVAMAYAEARRVGSSVGLASAWAVWRRYASIKVQKMSSQL